MMDRLPPHVYDLAPGIRYRAQGLVFEVTAVERHQRTDGSEGGYIVHSVGE